MRENSHILQRPTAELSSHNKVGEFILASLILIIPNVVTWIIVFPGYFQADHQTTILSIAASEPSQWHSLLWGYFAFPFLYHSPSYAMYGLVQIILFYLTVIWSIYRLKKIKLIKSSVPISIFFGIFPTYVMYNELYCSDIVFAYFLIPLTVQLVEIVKSRGKCLHSIRYCVGVVAVAVIVCNLRKQAILIAALLLLCSIIWKPLRHRFRGTAVFGIGIVLALALNSSFTLFLNATKSPSQEMLAVPSTQIAYVVKNNGVIPDYIKDDLFSIKTNEEWGESYLSYCADLSKNGIELSPEFIRTWLVLGINNPAMYLNAYCQLMHPFWELTCTTLATNEGPQCGTHIDFGDYDSFTLNAAHNNFNGKISASYLEQFGNEKSPIWHRFSQIYSKVNSTHFPILTDLCNLILFNRALPLWFAFGFVLIIFIKNISVSSIIPCIPLISLLISFLLFAPEPLFRYSVELYYVIPILILYLRHLLKDEAKSRNLPSAHRKIPFRMFSSKETPEQLCGFTSNIHQQAPYIPKQRYR